MSHSVALNYNWLFSVLFLSSIAETWKNCLDGATDFKEVNYLLVLQSVVIGFLYVADWDAADMASKNEFPSNLGSYPNFWGLSYRKSQVVSIPNYKTKIINVTGFLLKTCSHGINSMWQAEIYFYYSLRILPDRCFMFIILQ